MEAAPDACRRAASDRPAASRGPDPRPGRPNCHRGDRRVNVWPERSGVRDETKWRSEISERIGEQRRLEIAPRLGEAAAIRGRPGPRRTLGGVGSPRSLRRMLRQSRRRRQIRQVRERGNADASGAVERRRPARSGAPRRPKQRSAARGGQKTAQRWRPSRGRRTQRDARRRSVLKARARMLALAELPLRVEGGRTAHRPCEGFGSPANGAQQADPPSFRVLIFVVSGAPLWIKERTAGAAGSFSCDMRRARTAFEPLTPISSSVTVTSSMTSRV